MSQITLMKSCSSYQQPTSFTLAQQHLQSLEPDRAGLLRYSFAISAVYQASAIAVAGSQAKLHSYHLCACVVMLVLWEQVLQLQSHKPLASKDSCHVITLLRIHWYGRLNRSITNLHSRWLKMAMFNRHFQGWLLQDFIFERARSLRDVPSIYRRRPIYEIDITEVMQQPAMFVTHAVVGVLQHIMAYTCKLLLCPGAASGNC